MEILTTMFYVIIIFGWVFHAIGYTRGKDSGYEIGRKYEREQIEKEMKLRIETEAIWRHQKYLLENSNLYYGGLK